jgi:hypothetical protein
MKSATYPLSLPTELLKEVRKASKKTGLSIADAMCQSMKLGLPTLVAKLTINEALKSLQPMTLEECRRCWEVPDREFDALAAHCASLPKALLEDV